MPLTKLAFGREHPDAERGPTAWFEAGTSFVSDSATSPFAAAEAVRRAFDHSPWVALPIYAAAVASGVGRIGQDRHWASDIVGSALLSIFTTRLLGSLHDARDPEAAAVSLLPSRGVDGSLRLLVVGRY